MAGDDLKITEDKTNSDTCRLILEGRITSVTSNDLSFKLFQAEKKYKHIILNMRKVSYLSSGGIRILIMYFKSIKGSGGSFHVEMPSENVKNVLGMVALDEMLLK